MSVKNFENQRWLRDGQKLEFRHRVALDMVTSGTVLDLGSGDGLLLSLLSKKGVSGAGLDISDEGVSRATAMGLDTRVFDFGNNPLPFPDNSFDTVIALDVLEHLYDPTSLLKEATRVSKKHIVIGVPNFSSLPARIQMMLGRVPENNRPKKGHIYWFTHGILSRMLSDTKLHIISMRSNTLFESMPVLSIITKYLAKVMPNLFSLSYVVQVEKQSLH